MSRTADLAETARKAWAQWRVQAAEKAQWRAAYDFAALRELTARWCLGELSWSAVGQRAPRDLETWPIGSALAAINRAGLLTTHSQPADEFDGGRVQQRAFVEGYATPEVEEALRHLIAGTRLRMASQMDAGWWTSRRGAEPAYRVVLPDGWIEGEPQFGSELSAEAMALEFTGPPGHILDQIDEMPRITVWDPQWRPSDLLWRRLAVPDWERPPPLSEDDRAPADAVPSDAEVDRLDREMEEAFAERDLWWDLWRASGLDEDERRMEECDRLADYLLTLYNAACQAQYAEVERRRAENLARLAECGICDEPVAAHPSTEWAPGGADPEDGHHFCPKGRRCPTCQAPEPSTPAADLHPDFPPAPPAYVSPNNSPREH